MALLTNNSPTPGFISWNAMGMSYADGNFPVPAGNTNKKYVIWRYNSGVPTLEMTDTKPTTMEDGDTVLFLNMGGLGSVIAGTPLIDGALVVNGSITANEIKANAIEAQHIKAGSVGAEEIAAGAITAEKLSVGSAGENLCANGGFEDFDAEGYIAAWETPVTPTNGTLTVADQQGQMASGKMAIVFAPATTAANIRFRQKLSHLIPVSGTIGKKYYVGAVAGVGGTATTNGFYIRVNWYNGSGVQLASPNNFTDVKSNIGLTPSFALYDGSVTAPSAARYMGLEFLVVNPSVVSNVHLDDIHVHEITIGAHIDSEAITAAKIKAGEIVAGHLAAGTITADKIAVADFSNYAHGGNFDTATDLANWNVPSTVSLATTGHYAGTGCIQATASPGSQSMLMRDLPEVVAGDKYHISYYFKSTADWNGTGGNSKVRIGDQNGALITAPVYGAVSTSWKLIEQELTIPAGMRNMQVSVVFDHTAGTAYIDSLQIRRKNGGELIVDGAIVGKHISAGSISTDKLSVGTVGDSLVTNGSFEEFANGMAVGWRATAQSNGTISVPTGIASSGAYALSLAATAANANLRIEQDPAKFIPVTNANSRRWYISARAGATVTTTTGFYIRVSWYDQNKTYMNYTDVRSNGGVSTTWNVYEGQVVPIANAKYMAINIFFINPNVLSTLYVDEITAREVVVAAVIGDGQITTAKLVSKAITADKMAIMDTTNYLSDPGFESYGVGWNNVSTTTAPATGGLVATIANPRVDGVRGLRIVADGVNNKDVSADNLSVRGGDWYYASCYVRKTVASTGPTTAQVQLAATITGAAANTWWWPTFDAKYHQDLPLNEWVLFEGQVEIPDGAKWLQLRPTVRSQVTAGTFEFDDFQLRRMNAGELIVDGTIKANHLETDLVLATRIVAGDPNSTHAEMSPEGFRVFADDPLDGIPNEVVRLGVAGTNDYFAITKSDGGLAATIDQSGRASFSEVNTSAMSYKGQSFDDMLWNMPRGHIGSAFRTTYSAYNAVAGQPRQPYLRLDMELQDGRLYKISTSQIRAGVTVGGNCTVYLTAESGSTASEYSNIITFAEVFKEAESTDLSELYTPTLNTTAIAARGKRLCSFMIAFSAGAGECGLRANDQRPVRLLVEDVGPVINTYPGVHLDGANQTPPPPQKVTYVRQYGCNGSANYLGGNGRYTHNDSVMYQGLQPGTTNGNLKSIALFPDMTPDLSGATINYIRVYFNFQHWYYNSGGTARIGAHSHMGIPGTFSQIGIMTSSGGWPKPGARWVDLPSNTFDGFKTGAYRGVTLEGDGTYGTYGYAERPTIEISFTK